MRESNSRWVTLLTLIGASAFIWLCIRGIFSYGFDADEFEHAHVAWLVSTGAIPFKDFFECHPPFYWFFIGQIQRFYSEDVTILYVYRTIDLFGKLLFVALLIMHASISSQKRNFSRIVLLAIAAGSTPFLVNYLCAARMDAWANSFIMLGLLVVRSNVPKSMAGRYCLFGFLTTLGIFIHPRIAYLPVIYIVLDGVMSLKNRPKLISIVQGSGGVAAALFILWACLKINKVDLSDLWVYGIQFHWVMNRAATESFALFNKVSEFSTQSILILLGMVSLGWLVWQKKVTLTVFEVSCALFLIIQLTCVSFAYDQFYIPLFLISVVFLHYIADVLEIYLRPAPIVMALVLNLIIIGNLIVVSWDQRDEKRVISMQMNYIRTVLGLVPLDGYVATPAIYHPIFRRDSFYGWVQSFNGPFIRTEHIMQKFPEYAGRFSDAEYRNELTRRPPTVIFPHPDRADYFYAGQNKVLKEYLEKNKDVRDLQDILMKYVR